MYEITIRNNFIISQLLRINLSNRVINDFCTNIESLLILNIYFFPPSLVPLFISLSSGNAIIGVVPKGHDKVAQLVPFANNFLSFSLSLLIVCLFLASWVSLYLPTQIIITMVGTARQTMLCEILGILDC